MQSAFYISLLVLVTQTIGDKARAECETSAQYVIPNFKTNWYKAMEYCHYLGLKLTRISSIDDQLLIEEVINGTDKRNGTNLWTGGNDLGDAKNFHWYSTGTRITWFNWFDDKESRRYSDSRDYDYPSSHSGHCIHLGFDKATASWIWKLTSCEENLYFICEREVFRE